MQDTHTQTRFNKEEGFTLVELAIVMIIIGLLIGGVLKGQELINNAQVTSTITTIRSLDAAINTFQDMFSAIPGDMANAANRLPNCNAAPCNFGSNGNGFIDQTPGAAPNLNTEAMAFHSHLAAANLVTGVNLPPTDPAALNGGDELLEPAVGGVFTVGHSNGNVADFPNLRGGTPRFGHYLAIQTANAALGTTNADTALTAAVAAQLDRKLDDGRPLTGTVLAAGLPACVVVAGGSTIYQEFISATQCGIYSLLGN